MKSPWGPGRVELENVAALGVVGQSPLRSSGAPTGPAAAAESLDRPGSGDSAEGSPGLRPPPIDRRFFPALEQPRLAAPRRETPQMLLPTGG